MTRRKYSPLHDFWHPRVEGQIRHTIGRHPGWFNIPPRTSVKNDIVGSLAKRIVGEIVAASLCGDIPGHHDGNCGDPVDGVDASVVSSRKGRRPKGIVAPLDMTWYDAKKVIPENGGAMPYLVTYEANSGRRRVTTAVWAGVAKGWIFKVPRFKRGLSKNVILWAKYPTPPDRHGS